MCPWGDRLIAGGGSLLGAARLVCLCLVVECGDSLALIDTGLGRDDIAHEGRALPLWFRLSSRPQLRLEQTAYEQIKALGYQPDDVRHIVLTHLDVDHAGGLADFPWAEVHVSGAELAAANRRSTWGERQRYLPRQWAHEPRWRLYAPGGDTWMGFESVRCIDDEIALIPLPGHTRGHCAVAVPLGRGEWVLHAGDAFFHPSELQADPWCPAGLRVFQRAVAVDNAARLRNLARLRQLAMAQRQVRVVCAHSPLSYERLRRDLNG